MHRFKVGDYVLGAGSGRIYEIVDLQRHSQYGAKVIRAEGTHPFTLLRYPPLTQSDKDRVHSISDEALTRVSKEEFDALLMSERLQGL